MLFGVGASSPSSLNRLPPLVDSSGSFLRPGVSLTLDPTHSTPDQAVLLGLVGDEGSMATDLSTMAHVAGRSGGRRQDDNNGEGPHGEASLPEELLPDVAILTEGGQGQRVVGVSRLEPMHRGIHERSDSALATLDQLLLLERRLDDPGVEVVWLEDCLTEAPTISNSEAPTLLYATVWVVGTQKGPPFGTKGLLRSPHGAEGVVDTRNPWHPVSRATNDDVALSI